MAAPGGEQLVDSTWLECADDDGNVYYYNTATQESTWQLPGDVVDVTPFDLVPQDSKSRLAAQIERARTLDNIFAAAEEGAEIIPEGAEGAEAQEGLPLVQEGGETGDGADSPEKLEGKAESGVEAANTAPEDALADKLAAAEARHAEELMAEREQAAQLALEQQGELDAKDARIESQQAELDAKEELLKQLKDQVAKAESEAKSPAEEPNSDWLDEKLAAQRVKLFGAWQSFLRRLEQEIEDRLRELGEGGAVDDAQQGLRSMHDSLQDFLTSGLAEEAEASLSAEGGAEDAQGERVLLQGLREERLRADKLQAEVEALTERAAALEADASASAQAKAALQAELESSEKRNAEALEAQRTAHSRLEEEMAKERAKLETLLQDAKAEQESHAAAAQQALESQASELRGELEQAQAAAAQAKSREKRLEQECEQLSAEIQQLRGSLGLASTRENSKSMRVREMEADMAQMKALVCELRAQSEKVAKQQEEETAARVEALEKALETARADGKRTGEEAEVALKKMQEQHHRQVEDWRRAQEELVRRTNANAKEMQQRVEALQIEVDTLSKRADRAEKECHVAQLEAQALHESASQALREADMAQNETRELELELVGLRRRWASERQALIGEQQLLRCQIADQGSKAGAVVVSRQTLALIHRQVVAQRAATSKLGTEFRAQLGSVVEDVAAAREGLARFNKMRAKRQRPGQPVIPQEAAPETTRSQSPQVRPTPAGVEPPASPTSEYGDDASALLTVSPGTDSAGDAAPSAEPRRVLHTCRIVPRACSIMESAILATGPTIVELCSKRGRSKAWAVDNLADVDVHNDALFDALGLAAHCFAQRPRGTFCGVLHGDLSAGSLHSLVGSSSDPGLLPQSLWALAQNLGFASHQVDLELVEVGRESCARRYLAKRLRPRSVRQAHQLVAELEPSIPEQAEARAQRKQTGKASSKHGSGKSKKGRTKGKSKGAAAKGANRTVGAFMEARAGHESAASASVRVYTVFVDEAPRLQFVALPDAMVSEDRASWSEGPEEPTASSGAVLALAQATRDWATGATWSHPEETNAAPASLDNPLLRQLFFLQHGGGGTVHVVTHVLPTLEGAEAAAVSLNDAKSLALATR